MPADVAIRVQNVSKHFTLYHSRVLGRVLEWIFPRGRERYGRRFTAVNNVSFEVSRGEVVGIIGPNGSGKTTLLKMIAGLLPVDEGRIEVNGKVTALLALGVGVHPEFTGRENIIYGGMLLGMSKREMLRKLPEIVEFADIGEFIDEPFRMYSSGMRARVLFSAAMSIEPEILIIDEALATGDAGFIEKCGDRIHEICRSGATVVFVSHNLGQIRAYCSSAVFLARGTIAAQGVTADIAARYDRWVFESNTRSVAGCGNKLPRVGGSGEVIISTVRLLDSQGQVATGFHSGGTMAIEIGYRRERGSIVTAHLFVGFLDAATGSYVGEINTVYGHISGLTHNDGIVLQSEGIIKVVIATTLLLTRKYALWIIFHDGQKHSYCEYRYVTPFFVSRPGNALMSDAYFWQPCTIEPQGLKKSQ